MTETPLVVAYQLTPTTPRTVPVRRSEATPPLHASTLKGAVRRQAVGLAEALGLPPCQGDGDARCPVCRLFGAPGREAALRWSDARPEHATGKDLPLLESRGRRPVNRALGASPSVTPTVEQTAAAGVPLVGEVQGWLTEGGNASAEEDAAFLCAALLLVRRVGGGQGAGFGGVRFTVNRIQLGEAQRTPDDLLASLPGRRGEGAGAEETGRS